MKSNKLTAANAAKARTGIKGFDEITHGGLPRGREAFVRLEQKLVNAKGCGLGLVVAKQLTQLSGGQFSVRLGDDGGTLVQIVTPSIRRRR